VADITYLPTQEGVAYLSLVTDAFSRKIVGYHVHESLHTESVASAASSSEPTSNRAAADPLFGQRQPVLLGHVPSVTCETRHQVFYDGRL
jgi:hypothetical protein